MQFDIPVKKLNQLSTPVKKIYINYIKLEYPLVSRSIVSLQATDINWVWSLWCPFYHPFTAKASDDWSINGQTKSKIDSKWVNLYVVETSESSNPILCARVIRLHNNNRMLCLVSSSTFQFWDQKVKCQMHKAR